MYQFGSRIRYSEVDMKQNLTLNAIINYFQDCSTFHSKDIGLGISYLEERKRAWVLSSWQIVIHRTPTLGEQIMVQTWPYDFKGFYGGRNFALQDEKGNRVVEANSIWVYINLETGHPVKLSEDEIAKYQLDEKLDMEYTKRKIPVPKETVEMSPHSVVKYQLDTNNHVNNGQYVLMASEFLPDGFQIRQMRAEYKKAAMLHDIIIPRIHLEEESCTVALCNTQGQPFAVVVFDK